MDLLLRQRYGPRSERIDPNQLRLFTEEGGDPVPSEEPTSAPECPAKPKRPWKRRGRQALPEHLPRVPVVIELSEHGACPAVPGRRDPGRSADRTGSGRCTVTVIYDDEARPDAPLAKLEDE